MRIQISINMYIYICIYVCSHALTHKCTQTYTHTHKRTITNDASVDTYVFVISNVRKQQHSIVARAGSLRYKRLSSH